MGHIRKTVQNCRCLLGCETRKSPRFLVPSFIFTYKIMNEVLEGDITMCYRQLVRIF